MRRRTPPSHPTRRASRPRCTSGPPASSASSGGPSRRRPPRRPRRSRDPPRCGRQVPPSGPTLRRRPHAPGPVRGRPRGASSASAATTSAPSTSGSGSVTHPARHALQPDQGVALTPAPPLPVDGPGRDGPAHVLLRVRDRPEAGARTERRDERVVHKVHGVRAGPGDEGRPRHQRPVPLPDELLQHRLPSRAHRVPLLGATRFTRVVRPRVPAGWGRGRSSSVGCAGPRCPRRCRVRLGGRCDCASPSGHRDDDARVRACR